MMVQGIVAALFACALAGLPPVFAGDGPAWRGDDLAVWTNRPCHLADVCVRDGALRGRIVGEDPFFTLKLAEPFVGTVDQCVRFKVRATCFGQWSFFWVSEKNGRYGSPDVVRFRMDETNVWKTVECRPFWSHQGKIRSLRIDPPKAGAGEIEIGEIAVVDSPLGFKPFDSAVHTGVTFALASEAIEYGEVDWHSAAAPCGLKRIPFTTAADGARHVYWFDLARAGKTFATAGRDCWTGEIDYFAVGRSPGCAPFPVEDLRLVNGKPDLPPDVGITSALPEEAIPRAGRPLALEIVLRNYGTQPARNVRFSFRGLPSDLKIADARELSPTGEVAAATGRDSVGIGHDYARWRLPNERRFRVAFEPPKPGPYAFELEVAADGCPVRRKRTAFKVLPSLQLPKAAYVPEPHPVRTGEYKVGATLFPGWTSHHWHAIWSRAPERKPVLGWYDESQVETIDWQIKQLVENGISWVLVCWYWDWRSGTPGAGISVWPETFQKARYRRHLKWCLQWGVRSSGGHVFTVEDMRAAARHWCSHYFNTDEYLKIDGCPVVDIFTGYELARKFGVEQAKSFLDAARACAREAGFPGIHFVAQRERILPSVARELKAIGFDRTSIYKYISDDDPSWKWSVPRSYGKVAETSLGHWRQAKLNSPLPLFPSLSTGYDPRPWIGALAPLFTTNVTAQAFRRICRDAKRHSDESGERYLLMGPLDEWGEGSIGYPNRALGWGMLESVRETFGEKPSEGWPVNIAPQDVGLECPQLPGTGY